MDYDAIDREMSCWVVGCVHNGTQFYLTNDSVATDILANTPRYRWYDQAETVATQACKEIAWVGFNWHPISRAAVRAAR